jgi:aromatic ring-opening dioxygenase catalytic subunit (LigB family)
MSEIVAAFGLPHNPHFPTWVRQGINGAEEIRRLYGAIAERLAEARPDVIVYFTSDHYNNFWESLPIFAIAVAESAHGASDYPELSREVPIDSELARQVHFQLVRRGFDVAMVQDLQFDHTVIAPLQLMDEAVGSRPLLPVFINGFIRPLPSAERCRSLGGAIRDAILDGPLERRVAVIASGSFSLEIGGPRISDESHTGVPDPQWLERVLELLRAADVETLLAEATDEQLWRAGNAGGELLDWIAMLATFDARPPEFLDYQPQHGHAFAAWPRLGAVPAR